MQKKVLCFEQKWKLEGLIRVLLEGGVAAGIERMGGGPLLLFLEDGGPLFAADRGGFPLAGSSEIKLDLKLYDDLNSIFESAPTPNHHHPPLTLRLKKSPAMECLGQVGGGVRWSQERGVPLQSG